MITPTCMKRAIALSIVSFSLLVILSTFSILHHHEFDGVRHDDCAACLLFYTAIVLTAVIVSSICGPVAGTIRHRRVILAPVFVALEKNKRAPPDPLD